MARRAALFSIVLAACVVTWPSAAHAASPGSLDATFGSGGTLSLTDPGGLSGGGAVALPDGSIIVGANKGLISPTVVTLIKVDPNGHVDPFFHEDGFASAPPVSYPSLRSLTLAPLGKIVGVGIAATNGGGQAWLVTRFDPDGSLDQTFGNGGVVVMPMPGYSAAYAAAVQPDGAIVVGGASRGATGYDQHWALARFDAQGALDPSFGAGGVEVLPNLEYFGVRAIALQDDGDILAAGEEDFPSDPTAAVVARFLPDGGVDTTYGTDGSTVMPELQVSSMTLATNGRLVLAGRTHDGSGWGFGIAALDANGNLDQTFGTGGFTTPFDPGTLTSAGKVAIQSDGSIVVPGDAVNSIGGWIFAVRRFTSVGVPDLTFGTNGVVVEDLNPGHSSGAGGAYIQPDGRIVVTGGTDDSQNHPMYVLQRFFASDGPHTYIDSGPQGPVNTADVTFAFSSPDTNATFACSLDGAAFTSCSSPKEYPGLLDGSHTFQVRATDAADNIGPTASRGFVVDTIAPVVSIETGPDGTVYANKVAFGFSANETGATFECALDNQAFIPCQSPTVLTGLSDGSHAFQVQATDQAGNTGSPADRVFTVDTTDTLRPDALIGPGGGVPAGEDIFNVTGWHQRARLGIARGSHATFRVEIQNDGTLPDNFSVHARGSWPGCTLRYLHHGNDVTSDVVAGSFTTETLDPGAHTALTLVVKVKPTAALGLRLPDSVRVTSQTYGPATDVVVAIVRILR